MENLPPTYQEATDRSPIKILAPHIHPHDLFSASLVSKAWHSTLAPLLWEEPFDKFASTRNVTDMVARFTICIENTRPNVRNLVKTIDLSGMKSVSSNLPWTIWLSAMFTFLPSLFSMSLANVADVHGGLSCLAESHLGANRVINIKALDISRRLNGTRTGLMKSLRHFEGLVYLDISFMKDVTALQMKTMSDGMPRLQVLKARKIELRDQMCGNLAKGVGTRLWSLDLRDNDLTDAAVEVFLDYSFSPPEYTPERTPWTNGTDVPWFSPASWLNHDTAPFSPVYPFSKPADDWSTYTSAIPRVRPGTGLTHLYLSSNRMTSISFICLLATQRLEALDCGTLTDAPSLLHSLSLPLTRKALSWLRISHHMVTDAPLDTIFSQFAFPETLVLTSIPRYDPSGAIVKRLKIFCFFAALYEAHLARALWHARHGLDVMPRHGYPAPKPDQAKCLRRLELEMEPRSTGEDGEAGYEKALERVMSDEDIRGFWEESEGDFSFFEGEKEVPDRNKGKAAQSRASTFTHAPPYQAAEGKSDDQQIVEQVLEACERSAGVGISEGPWVAENMRNFSSGRIWPTALRYDSPGRDQSELSWSGTVRVSETRSRH